MGANGSNRLKAVTAYFGQLRSVGHLNYCPKGDNGIAIAPPLNIRTLQY